MLNENNFNIKFTIRSTVDAIKWFKSQVEYIMNPSKETLIKSANVVKAFTNNKTIYDAYKALKGSDPKDKKTKTGPKKKEDLDEEKPDSDIDPETGLPLSEENKTKAKILADKQKEIDEYDTVKRFEVGRMYLFHYDPKTKIKLPYYDIFPLIIMVQLAQGGFYGINFHYLPPKLRWILLGNLLSMALLRDGKLEKLNISYDSLNGAGNLLEPFKPCFKRYLYDHIRGAIKEIPPSDWSYAVALPFEDFKKKSKREVWKDSLDSLN